MEGHFPKRSDATSADASPIGQLPELTDIGCVHQAVHSGNGPYIKKGDLF